MKQFKVGDRVVIRDREHPWFGHAGVIFAPLAKVLDWKVELDGAAGHRVGVAERHIERQAGKR